MKKAIEKGIQDSGYNIKDIGIEDINNLIVKDTDKLMVDAEWEEFYNTYGNDFDNTALTNFLLWKILKRLEAKK